MQLVVPRSSGNAGGLLISVEINRCKAPADRIFGRLSITRHESQEKCVENLRVLGLQCVRNDVFELCNLSSAIALKLTSLIASATPITIRSCRQILEYDAHFFWASLPTFGCRQQRLNLQILRVAVRGLEPPREYSHLILNQARLPIPPHRRAFRKSLWIVSSIDRSHSISFA